MNIKNLKSATIVAILVVAMYVAEYFVTIYIQSIDLQKVRISGAYKLFFQLALLFLIDYKNINRKIVYTLSLIVFCFSVSLFLNPRLVSDFSWLLTNGSIYYFDRYLVVFLFALMIYSRKESFTIVEKSIRYVEIILLTNAFLILFSFFLGLDFFKSYYESSRFGYDGLFNKSNEASIVYIIYMIYIYHDVFINKTQKLIKFIFIACISLLMGTKSILLFLTLLLLFHFLFVFKGNKFLKPVILSCLIVLSLFFKNLVKYVFSLSHFWNNIDEDSILTLLLSYRDLLVLKNIDYINLNWSPINYLIGGSFYTNEFEISQMDGVDLFVFFGVLGMLAYCFLLIKILMKSNHILNGLIIIIFICGFLGGGLLTSAMSMILLFLICFKLNKNQETLSNV
ncbi:hypothetical protein [Winogradskyella sp.]|uniref:hypothetical protein n=1 Tax=Winogradskyella sp. TaxID=1883156 RepID=UPI0025FA7F97|nr:hypothetical protein [Winogradskyella sp.]